jgi:predicted Holliday junction resolvase-like endonuclease
VGYLVAKLYFLAKMKGHRQDAVDRSRSVMLGHVNEKIAPLLPNFPYHYKDLVFLGKGIDYLVFDGLSQGELRKIVFLEIKSGVSSLNKNERSIKECI